MLFPAVRHELAFWHGGGRFVGDLVLPGTTGPHPVVVMMGEPSATQRDHSSWLDGLAAAGIASFTWDRPPVPGTVRDPVRRAAEHAREALSAVGMLGCQHELAADAVALLGWGEGGWAAAQAATFSSRVRALVLAGTPTATPGHLVEHRVVQQLHQAGHAGSDIAAARDLVRRRLADRVAGRVWPSVRRQPTGPDVRGDVLVAADALTRSMTGGLDADPLPTLSAVTVPVLALFGEQDHTLPLEESVRGVREALRGAGHRDHRVAVVRGADHALRVRPGHGLGALRDGRHQFGEWPGGLTDVIVAWLSDRIRVPRPAPVVPPPVTTQPTVPPGGTRHPGPLPVRQVRRRISR